MVIVDLTTLIQPIAERGMQAVIDSALPESIAIPEDAGNKSSWISLILIGITLIDNGVGVYYLTCVDNKEVKLVYDGRTAKLITDGPIIQSVTGAIEESYE